MTTWLVTGGAGFIGGNFVLEAVAKGIRIINLDALTYAGNLKTLDSLEGNPHHVFAQGDIGDRELVARLLAEHRPDAVLNFAAESHVDRSIDGPGAFIQTNVVGTLGLLEAVRDYWKALPADKAEAFRFLHVSTDEVYGTLGETGKFTETTPYAPNSPYSASKAASDHLVRAFHHTYGLPVLTTNCSNNYGPYHFPEKLIPLVIAKALAGEALPVYGDLSSDDAPFTEHSAYAPSSPYSASKAASDHLVRAWNRTYGLPVLLTNCSNNYGPFHFPEKLIPLVILNALAGKPLPVYGNGLQVRDWLFVEDHARALLKVATEGVVGETYNIGGHNEQKNIDVVRGICTLLEELAPERPAGVAQFADLITFVKDRPGHDQRYAIDASKIERELGWVPEETFETGLRKTVQWYLDNLDWCRRVQDGSYQGERLGNTDPKDLIA